MRAHLDLAEILGSSSCQGDFFVTRGKEYIVMGIMVRKESNCIYYLVDEHDWPSWVPYILFDISHAELSPDWHICIMDKKESTGTMFFMSGFKELCVDEDYHDALMEREKWALEIYRQRKYEVQEWYFASGYGSGTLL